MCRVENGEEENRIRKIALRPRWSGGFDVYRGCSTENKVILAARLSPRKKAAKKVRQIPEQESDGKWRTAAIIYCTECKKASADAVHVSVSPFGSYIICYIPYCFILDSYGMICIGIIQRS